MATSQRKLVQVFARTMAIDPAVTTAISLRADADDGILHVTIEVIPTITDEQLTALFVALREYSKQAMIAVVTKAKDEE